MGNWGIKVTKKGKGIDSTEPKDYVLNSKYSAVKIAKEGSGTVVVAGGGTAIGTITHNLGFEPVILLYTQLAPNKWFFGFPYAPDESDLYVSAFQWDSYVGTATAKFSIINDGGSIGTVPYYYFVMGDSAV